MDVNEIGGQPNLIDQVEETSTNLVKKQRWVERAGTEPDEGLTGINMVPIGRIFHCSNDNSSKWGSQLDKAIFDLQCLCKRIPTSFLGGSLSLGDSLSAYNATVSLKWIIKFPRCFFFVGGGAPLHTTYTCNLTRPTPLGHQSRERSGDAVLLRPHRPHERGGGV